MKRDKTLPTALIIGALLVALSACDINEGPAEKTGKNVDEATQRAGEKIEEAGEKIQDAAQGDD
jgi:predicted small secreted protein